jgi:hypothetical protein
LIGHFAHLAIVDISSPNDMSIRTDSERSAADPLTLGPAFIRFE